jgi:hypothetical protein
VRGGMPTLPRNCRWCGGNVQGLVMLSADFARPSEPEPSLPQAHTNAQGSPFSPGRGTALPEPSTRALEHKQSMPNIRALVWLNHASDARTWRCFAPGFGQICTAYLPLLCQREFHTHRSELVSSTTSCNWIAPRLGPHRRPGANATPQRCGLIFLKTHSKERSVLPHLGLSLCAIRSPFTMSSGSKNTTTLSPSPSPPLARVWRSRQALTT